MNSSARTLHEAAKKGFRRLVNFRAARLMFIKAFVGQYYDKTHGELGEEPLNMAFNAIRVLVPNLIARNPRIVCDTDYLAYRPYGELLALGLEFLAKKLHFPGILRDGIVDAIFTLGIFKTGLAISDNLVYFGEEGVDPGQLYVDTVDLDDFTFDPDAKKLIKASFLGEKFRIERESALASGLFDNAVIEKLPSSAELILSKGSQVHRLSKQSVDRIVSSGLHDYIDLMELWMEDSNTLVTLPFDHPVGDKFAREDTWYGPDSGPYTFLSLSPPVPNNPLPVALAGIWHDLHIVGNAIAKKALDQAMAQKDILGYQRQSADEAEEIVDAPNLAAVAMDNPQSAQMYSFGGANPVNIGTIAQIELWFNQFSGNTNMTGGLGVDAESATEATILNDNASTGLAYMDGEVHTAGNAVLRNLAWYLHTDPLIKLPLIRREFVPAEYNITDERIQMVSPARTQETQVFLTPEARRGDFIDYVFDIEHESMGPINWQKRLQQMEVLAVRIIPAAASAAQIAAQMGTPFSFRAFVTRVAKEMRISWIDEIFQSPELVAQMEFAVRQGPQPEQSKGVASAAAVKQNQGSAVGSVTPPASTQARQTAQAGAAGGQAGLANREMGRGNN